MEFIIENVKKYIIENEHDYYVKLDECCKCESVSPDAIDRACSRWHQYYKFAKEFGFVNELIG